MSLRQKYGLPVALAIVLGITGPLLSSMLATLVGFAGGCLVCVWIAGCTEIEERPPSQT